MHPSRAETTPLEPLADPAARDRAMAVLDWAASVAEERATPAVTPARPEDLIALSKLDPKTVRDALDRVIMGADPEAGLDALLEGGALSAIFPEVHAMIGFGDGEWRHKDVWKHTKQVVRQAVPRLEVRWSSLFHDIGKVKTRTI
ncbi:metal-dependent phosphohydrolase, partial [bacterium]